MLLLGEEDDSCRRGVSLLKEEGGDRGRGALWEDGGAAGRWGEIERGGSSRALLARCMRVWVAAEGNERG